MKFILCLALVFTTVFAFADRYKSVASDYYPALDLNEVSNKLYSFGLIEFDLSRKGHMLNGSFDQIFFDELQKNETAVLRLDIALESGLAKLKLSENEFVCHAETSRGRKFALYLKGRNEREFNKICNSLTKRHSMGAKFRLLKYLVPDAKAADFTSCDQKPNSAQHLGAVTATVADSVFAQRLGTCFTQSINGAKNYFNGLADTAKLFLEPEKLWKNISEQAIALKNFVINIRSELTKLSEQITNLDPELILHYGCQLAGESLVTAGAGALTGFGLAKLATLFSNSLVKLNALTPVFERLNALKKKGHGKIAKEIISCAR